MTSLTDRSLAKAFDLLQRAVRDTKNTTTSERDAMAAAVYGADRMGQLLDFYKRMADDLEKVDQFGGIDPYSQTELNDPAFVTTTNVQAIRTNILTLIDMIADGYPKDSNSYVLDRQMDANGNVTWRTFTVAQTAPLRTEMDNLLTAIG